MDINFNDEEFLSFLQEIDQNQALKAIFSGSKYWDNGGEQSIKMVCNSEFKSIPNEILQSIQLLINDVCPDYCEAGCKIEWNQMSAKVLNGDGLCDYHHNLKEKLDKE